MEIEEYIKEAEEMDKHPLNQEEFAKQIEDNRRRSELGDRKS